MLPPCPLPESMRPVEAHQTEEQRVESGKTEADGAATAGNGIDAPFIRIPDEGHGWRKLANQLFYFRKQAEFIEAQLGLAPAE